MEEAKEDICDFCHKNKEVKLIVAGGSVKTIKEESKIRKFLGSNFPGFPKLCDDCYPIVLQQIKKIK